jgi:hypothetical protein
MPARTDRLLLCRPARPDVAVVASQQPTRKGEIREDRLCDPVHRRWGSRPWLLGRDWVGADPGEPVTDKTKGKRKQGFDLYRYIMMTILVFIIFCVFDMFDGDPNGLRGLVEFFRLMAGI